MSAGDNAIKEDIKSKAKSAIAITEKIARQRFLIKPVSVKTLVEFSAKAGSLDRRFTPGPSGQEGIEGHQRVAANRQENYKTEVSLNIDYQGLQIRGRADGYAPDTHCLEEIKTFYGDFENIPDNHRELHWAQVKFYGWMLCHKEDCETINLALVYYHLGDQKEYRLEQAFTRQDLRTYCETLAEKYFRWQAQINQRMASLHDWIEHLIFPYPELHPSQRQMAEAVYKAAVTGRVLLAEAPTGTGKTLAGLFPAIKAMTRTDVDRIFYLTAKTTGKQLALENLQLIASDSATSPLRVLELTAQEKSCLEPDKRCSGDSCSFALDFYSKLEVARQAACNIPILDKQQLSLLAQEFHICPFYLGMEMSRWTDIIVADFNYYFDGSPLLLNLTKELNWHPYLLVDESHNLLDRGRQMYSAELDRGLLLAAKRQAPAPIKKALERVNKIWLGIIKSLREKPGRLTLVSALPEGFIPTLVDFTNRYVELLQQHPEHPVQTTCVQELFFSALQFQTVSEYPSEDFCIDMQHLGSKAELLTLRNLIPGKLLAERRNHAHSACFFSATLTPADFYHTLLGLPEDCVHLRVDSPFSARQLEVNFATHLSTRYKDRAAAIEPLCEIVKHQLITVQGNALIFFSSYEFLQQVEQQLYPVLRDLDVQLITQSRKMSEEDRREFIAQFSIHNNLLGLAVLGGAFSEGIDLAGDALKGVFIATLGLPQINPVNEYMRELMQRRFQRGYNFTYLYPGITKVIQAAGRVIRNPQDQGYLWLLDDRFGQPEIRALLPDWWQKF